LRNTGEFFVANEGKRPIYIDGKPVLQGSKQKLNDNSVVEVRIGLSGFMSEKLYWMRGKNFIRNLQIFTNLETNGSRGVTFFKLEKSLKLTELFNVKHPDPGSTPGS
jgi:hypothetical protein